MTNRNRSDLGASLIEQRQVEDEPTDIRIELQSTIEHLETANEEATSVNKELQSINEELNTINSRLKSKIGELENVANDLNNLLAGSEVATLFLDNKFCIKWFSPTIRELLDLVSTDIGRPISHFARKFRDEKLLTDAEAVLDKLSIIDVEVLADSGRWYLRRMLPYRTRDNHIAGVVVTFNDITDRKFATDAAESARVYSEAIVETLRQPLLVLTADLHVESANRAFCHHFQVRPSDIEGGVIYTLGNGQWDIPGLRTLLKEVLPKNQFVENFEVEHVFSGIGRRNMVLNARKLVREGCDEELILLVIEDVTQRSESGKALEQSAQLLKDLINALPVAVYMTDATGLITFYNHAAVKMWRREPHLGVDRWCGSLRLYRADGTPLPHDECPMAIAVKENRQILGAEAAAEGEDGHRIPFLAYPTPLRDASGALVGAVNMLMDNSESQRTEQHRVTLIAELNHRVKNMLTVVQSIASQTFGHMQGQTMDETRETFESRLINLAHTHDVLTRENWVSADLKEIVGDTVTPYSSGGARFDIEGPAISLLPNAALAIAMTLHELATNATKYGALSCSEGRVGIIWRIDETENGQWLKLSWIESDGPLVTKPTRKGFGSRLIERALATELDGMVRIVYNFSGVVCTIDAPLARIQNKQQRSTNTQK